MLNGRRLSADTFCDVYNLLQPWIDEEFWDLATFDPAPGSICIVGRQQVVEHTDKLRQLCNQDCRMIFANSAEGSSTQLAQLRALKLEDLVLQGQLLLLTGGRIPEHYSHLLHEHFLVRILAYEENLLAMQRVDEIFRSHDKPFKFLFLNGRARPHRKYLWERFRQTKLLDHALWTMLDGRGIGNRVLSLRDHQQDLMDTFTPIRHLPREYEVARYQDAKVGSCQPNHNIKFDIFKNEWGEIYLEIAPYRDTYFSVVTETVLEYPYSFFTEKIAKPLAQGHPWIVASNRGFYSDIRNLGFRTFRTVIDEGFDNIDNDQDRMERIVEIVNDLCQQDLPAFLRECEDICKYNQHHLATVVDQEKKLFPEKFFQFIDKHG